MQLRRVYSLFARGLVFAALFSLFAWSSALRAQQPAQDNSHIISPSQLQQQVQDSAAVRQKNIDTLTQFLSTPQAEQAMKIAHANPEQVKTAIPQLSNAELANLSSRASHAQQDFAAGRISNGALIVILIAVIVVIILIFVH